MAEKKSAPIKLYAIELSPPSRAVWMLLEQLGIDFEWITVNVLAGDQHKKEFLQMNPYHSLPTIDDNSFILWESRAILRYVMNKHAKNKSLYPEDPQERAQVDRILDLDVGTVYGKMAAYAAPQIFGGSGPDKALKDAFGEALDKVNGELAGRTYLAGEKLTIADISMLSSLAFAHHVDFQYTSWPHVSRWLELCKKEVKSYRDCFAKADAIAKRVIDSKKK